MSLTVTGLTKHYRKKTALSDVTLSFEPETIYGLLGTNGAGKSTLLNIVANRTFPSAGDVMLDNTPLTDSSRLLRTTYLMSEDNMFPPTMRVDQMWSFTEGVYGSFDWDLANRLAKDFEIDIHTAFSKLSTGFRTIAKLIAALSVPVDYLFLDEPILGLDATNRDTFYRALMDSYAERPRTIVLSTHIIGEIAALLEHVIIIDHGTVLLDTPAEKAASLGYEISGPTALIDSLRESPGLSILDTTTIAGTTTLYTTGPLPDYLPHGIERHSLQLQDLFIHLTHASSRSVQ